MVKSVSHHAPRYIENLRKSLSEKTELNLIEQAILEGPREALAWAASGLGQRIMRLGRRIHESAPNGDEHEAWGKGYEVGRAVARLEAEGVAGQGANVVLASLA